MNRDYQALREKMVREQIKSRGIRDARIIEAFLKVPREEFIPKQVQGLSYEDYPLSIGFGQTISQPYIVALMTEALDPQSEEKILEIGTGSGYQAAILAYLGAKVYSVERISELANQADRTLKKLGYDVKIKIGDGTLGWQEEGPFSGIIVTAASHKVPPPLIEQLEIGGRIVIPLGGALSQVLTKIEKLEEGKVKEYQICGCIFVPLVGKYGFKK